MKPQALILAGGEGKRFWPLTTPKSQFKFLGKSLLAHNLGKIKAAGFSDAIIVVSPSNQKEISQIKISDLNISTVVQKRSKGMADAVISSQDSLSEVPLLIINATEIINKSFLKVLYNHLTEGKNFVVYQKVDSYFNGGYLKVTGNKVEEIIEKPGKGKEPSNLVNLAIHGIQRPKILLKVIKQTSSDKDDIYEVAFSKLLKQIDFEALRYRGNWQAVKFPWDVLKVSKLMLSAVKSEISVSAQVSKKAIIKGKVFIADGVKIYENAIIKGPAYIGKNTVIGNGSLVRDSIIGENCVVGYSTEIARSYIGDDCWFHSNYLGDSVLEANVGLGAGVVLANLRLDEGEIGVIVGTNKVSTGKNKLGAIIGQNVRLGVNSNLMPGVKIGSGTFIGSGLTIDQDIADSSFVKGKSKLEITKNTRTLTTSVREKFKKSL